MNQKKIGVVILALSIIVGALLINLISETKSTGNEAGCFQNKECVATTAVLNSSNLGIGIIFALFSLAIYLIIFSRGDEFWLKKLEQQKQNISEEEKWKIIEMMLDKNEFMVIKAIKEQDGITQFTLRLRTDLSKSKLSDILTKFEKRGLIERQPKGKSLAVFLKKAI
ncbi:MAG: MarR family transcriptional regulator [Nanoarchaeota archaeon]|nr:MarR family transcriptional regulator [Nanoarchaeota archaeon]